jgi:hypothetical protein
MSIVHLALRGSSIVVVAALLLMFGTPFVLLRTQTDIFPQINIEADEDEHNGQLSRDPITSAISW